MKKSKKMQAVYIVGGIMIVAAAIKVVYSGCKCVVDYLQPEDEEED